MRSPSPSRSTSEHRGRAVTLCPPLIGRSRPIAVVLLSSYVRSSCNTVPHSGTAANVASNESRAQHALTRNERGETDYDYWRLPLRRNPL